MPTEEMHDANRMPERSEVTAQYAQDVAGSYAPTVSEADGAGLAAREHHQERQGMPGANQTPEHTDLTARYAQELTNSTPPAWASASGKGDAIAEQMEESRQERLDAIAESHAAGDNYFDGYTTIDGQEVEVWLTPDGSTVYYDRDDDSVVDIEWNSNADRNAAMEAAHDQGDAFYDGTTEVNGEEVQVWIAPDGMEVYVDPDTGDVVAIRWPDGQAPEYQGQVMYDGESVAVYEYPNGTYGLVSDGETVLLFDDWDEVDLDTTYHHGHEQDVYSVPQGPPTYDTIVYDADTGVPLEGGQSGTTMLDGALTHYQPPGEDYVVVIDQFGNVLGTFELPPDEDWSILGVTKYEDGSVTIDLGGGEITVDLDSDGGIWFTSDGLGELIEGADWVGSVEAGVEWDEDGVAVDVAASILDVGEFGYGFEVGDDGFDVHAYAEMEVDIGGKSVGVSASGEFGYSNGNLYAGGDVGVAMTIGLLELDASVGGYVEVGPDGFQGEAYWDGKAGLLGFFVEGGQAGAITLGPDGLTATYSEYRGVGHDALGSVRAGYEGQIHTDGTKGGTEMTGGLYVSTNDRDGEETGVFGGYVRVDGDGDVSGTWRDERLDTGVTRESYDRHEGNEDENLPDAPDGSADFDLEQEVFVPGRLPADEVPDDATDEVADEVAEDRVAEDRVAEGWRADRRDDLPFERLDRDPAGEPPIDDVTQQSMADNRIETGVRKDSSEAHILDGGSAPTGGVRNSGAPDTSDAQFVSDPPADPPAEDDTPPVEQPKIFTRRDSDAKTPDEEEPPAPEPQPTPPGDRPKLFERDGDTPTDDGPTDGPRIKPDLFAERFQDNDEDGDGVPDGRFDPDNPIGTDETTLSDIVQGGPTAASTVAATPDQAPGTIDHPEPTAEESPADRRVDPGVRKDSGEAHIEAVQIADPLIDDITATPAPRALPSEPEVDAAGDRTPAAEPVAAQDEAPVIEPTPVTEPTPIVEQPLVEHVIGIEPAGAMDDVANATPQVEHDRELAHDSLHQQDGDDVVGFDDEAGI